MYVLLTGAKKNAGDFFIAHAAKRLFERLAPDPEHQELPSWMPLGKNLDLVNSGRALVLCGGPAFQKDIGQRIYPILDDLHAIKVPIIAFGLGWKAVPGDEYDVETFVFPAATEPLFVRLRNDFPYAGCRDYLTWRILRRNGFANACMTGCPTWYDPDHLGKPLVIPQDVRRIVFTPAESPRFRGQSMGMMQRVKDLFPHATTVCSFHRGWVADAHTTQAHADNARLLKGEADRLGWEAMDASGSLDAMDRYCQYDLHIGYRVHAHYKFLSVRRPSFLIAEDSRGRGAMEAMGLPGVLGWTPSAQFRFFQDHFPHPAALRLVRRRGGGFSISSSAACQLERLIEEELSTTFARFDGALAVIDATWNRMLEMIRSMPGPLP
jgi:hypothetical protein